MTIAIKHRFTSAVLFQSECDSWRAAVEAALKSGADLSGADLSGANLYGADLSGAKLYGADLSGAKNIPLLAERQSSIVPADGPLWGWKKCRDGVLVKVSVGDHAKRSNATGRKCRAEYVKVLEVIGAEIGESNYNAAVVYKVGETVKCDKWDDNRWNECSGGIHFLLTREEAEAYQ
jgi:hypothetical protein